MNKEIFPKVRDIIAQHLKLEAEEVKADSALIDDLYADSLDIVEITSAVEGKFDIEIPDEEVYNFTTVRNIITCVERHIG